MEKIQLITKKIQEVFRNFFERVRSTYTSFVSTKKGRVTIRVILSLFVVCTLWYGVYIQAPGTFPEHSLFTVPEGATLSQISTRLYNQGYIVSPFWFKIVVSLTSGSSSVQAGDYFFAESKNILSLARRLVLGNHGLLPEKITIPEGLHVFKIAEIFKSKFPQFDPEYFIEHAPEGYLFPDTYFFLPNVKAQDVIDTMRQNFDKQIISVKEDIEAFGKPLEEVIKMASILEGEARQFETRQVVSGILWNRIRLKIPLQVDTSFVYINGKNSFTLTTEDLEEDSPYNSYTRLGLPPTPISSPGLEAIQAAVTPVKTNFLYFLTDKTGVMRYSADYEGHLKNRRLYLGK
ncbi:MAG: hypothetical protein RJA61_218 [Candidatus Parcubacteria bacterium]|jgi:UPF0755 protein